MKKRPNVKIISLTDLPPDVSLRDLARIAFVLGYGLTIVAVEFEPKVAIAAKKIPYKAPHPRCDALTLKGKLCQSKPLAGTHRCKVHSG